VGAIVGAIVGLGMIVGAIVGATVGEMVALTPFKDVRTARIRRRTFIRLV